MEIGEDRVGKREARSDQYEDEVRFIPLFLRYFSFFFFLHSRIQSSAAVVVAVGCTRLATYSRTCLVVFFFFRALTRPALRRTAAACALWLWAWFVPPSAVQSPVQYLFFAFRLLCLLVV